MIRGRRCKIVIWRFVRWAVIIRSVFKRGTDKGGIQLDQAQLEKAAEAIREADALMIGAGAGMGVDSGLPDFRGDKGFWRAYPPFARRGLSFMEVANAKWFVDDPAMAWGFYGHRMKLYQQTDPHKGFEILLGWKERFSKGMFVYTSNVDAHFQRVGFADDAIVECHGSLVHLQCTGPCNRDIWVSEGLEIEVDEETYLAREPLPTCPLCGALARPNVLMFQDKSWVPERMREQKRQFESWREGLRDAKLLVLECGVGPTVPTMRLICKMTALKYDATLVRINPRADEDESTLLNTDDNDFLSLSTSALEALEALDGLLD